MCKVTIEKILARQVAERNAVMESSNRGKSAHALATMALEHGSSSAHAAASLLLAMEHGKPFDFESLLSFDSTNRAHADLIMLGYKPHELWPSKWMNEEGYHGVDIMDALRDKWKETL